MTFSGLAGILERCPNLRSLGVNLDASSLHDLPVHVDNQYTGITSEKVTDLDVGYAEWDNIEAVGNLLAGMCPSLAVSHLSRASHNDDPSDQNAWFEETSRWKEVGNFIAT